MKKLYFLFVVLSFLSLSSCEDVVEIELDESPPRLVIEASIFTPRSHPSQFQIIKLTTTAPFFEDEVPPATNAQISIRDSRNMVYHFEETEPGIYRNETLEPRAGMEYHLEIIYEEEVYRATEEFIEVPALEFIEQNDQGGFGGDNIEIRIFYTDPADESNYYLFRFLHESLSLQIYDDEFTDGNLTFAFFSEEELAPGDLVAIEVQGISRRFYEYMFILRSQAGSGGGPFQTQPTTVRGNIVNTTNPENFPFGFFRLSEYDRLNYTIQ